MTLRLEEKKLEIILMKVQEVFRNNPNREKQQPEKTVNL